jgi:hypothetical protein
MEDKTEQSLWNAVRAIEEHVLLLRHLAEHGAHSPKTAQELRERAEEMQHQGELVRRVVVGHPSGEIAQN